MSRIITFYSYKGGVGRTLALANIGVLLAKRGKRVLLMDWDLEAPGLDRYFRPFIEKGFDAERGVVHLLHEATTNSKADWRTHVQEVTVKTENVEPETTHSVSIIPSGVASPDYAQRVRSFSWATFIEEQNGGPIIERWREEWKRDFDFVLIDSRTGITDTGGVCTVLLPDVLVLVFTANDQSFEGALGIAQSVQIERRKLAVQRPPLPTLPLLSRFDGRKEIDLAEHWMKRFDSELKPLFDDWLPKQFRPLQIIELTKIPYVTLFSFGEPLPVLTHSLSDPEFPGFYLENATRLLASDFRDAAQIIDPTAFTASGIANRIQAVIEKGPIEELDLQQMLHEAERELGGSPELADLLGRASVLLSKQARFMAAEPLMRRALAIDEQSFGPDHPRIAVRLNNLAGLLHSTNRLAEAEPLLRRALAIDESSAPEGPNVATSLNNLATLLSDTNRLVEAEQLTRRALEITERIYGSDNASVAIRLSNLASMLMNGERWIEAEPLIRRALAIDEANYGAQHPDVAIDLNNLAHLLTETNRKAEAEPLISRALEIDEHALGPNHPNVAVRLNNLAQLLQSTNRMEEAEPLMRRALAIDEQSFGPDHPKVALRLHNLARLLQETNRLSEAQPLMRRALTIFNQFTAASGHVHPSLQLVTRHYEQLLLKMKLSPDEIELELNSIRSPM